MKRKILGIILSIIVLIGGIAGYYSRQQHLFQYNLKIRSIVALDKFLPESDLEGFIGSDSEGFKDSLNRFEYNIWDKTITYHINEYDGTELYPDKKSFQIEGADFDTFVPLISGRAKDKNTLYQYGKNMNIPSSGAKINYSYVLTETGVYAYGDFESGGVLLPQVDPKTFSMFVRKNQSPHPFFSKDENHVYFRYRLMTGVDSLTAKIVGGNYIKDKNGLYYINNENFEKVIGVDLQTIEDMGGRYMKDKNHIYYTITGNFIIQTGIDYNTFQSANYEPAPDIMKDKNHYYRDGKIFTGKMYKFPK